VDEKNNLRKDSNLGPLGYKGDSNHCINFFPLKILLKNLSQDQTRGSIKKKPR
jgi:hypothetical protein